MEQEVERLLDEDAMATEVQYGESTLLSRPPDSVFFYTRCSEVLENVNPDLSDSEFVEHEQPIDAPTPGFGESEIGDAPTPGPGAEGDGDEGDEEEGEGDIDEELAAELDLALGDEDGGGDEADEEEDEDEDDESEEEDDDDDDEATQTKKLLNEEIRDLEAAVAKKGKEVSSSSNPLIRVRQYHFLCMSCHY